MCVTHGKQHYLLAFTGPRQYKRHESGLVLLPILMKVLFVTINGIIFVMCGLHECNTTYMFWSVLTCRLEKHTILAWTFIPWMLLSVSRRRHLLLKIYRITLMVYRSDLLFPDGPLLLRIAINDTDNAKMNRKPKLYSLTESGNEKLMISNWYFIWR